jgi:hypothetical protein
MAQDIEVKIKVDASQAENSVNKFGDAVENTEKSITSLKGQLRQAQAEVAVLSDKFGATSKEAVNAAKKAAQLADKIGDAKALTEAFNPDAKFKALSSSLGGVAGGFAAVQGGMNLLGVESSETEEALLKVQSAMALSQGAQAVGESVDSFKQLGTVIKSTTVFQKISTAAQWLWNAAMNANPVGAVVLAITALLTAGYALVNWYKSSSDESKKNTESIKQNKTALENQSKAADSSSKSLQTNTDYQLAMAKASGASTAAIRKLELKLIDEKIAFANSSREIAKNTYHKNLNALASLKASDANEEQIKAQEELTKKSLEEFGKQTKNLNDANAEKGNIIRKQNVEIRQEQTNHNKEISDKNNTAADKAKEKALADRKAELDKINALEEGFTLKAVDTDKIKNENAKVAMISDLENKVAIGQGKLSFSKYIADEEIKIAQAEAQQKKDIQDASFNLASGAVSFLKEIGGKNKAIQKTAIIAENAMGIAKMIIANNVANVGALASPANILVPGSAAPIIAMNNIKTALGIATTVASTAKALSAVGGGSAGGGSAGGGGGGGGISTPASAQPSINVVGASKTNQIAETIAQQGQQPIKAYVVANDVTTQQGLDRNIVSSASIG